MSAQLGPSQSKEAQGEPALLKFHRYSQMPGVTKRS